MNSTPNPSPTPSPTAQPDTDTDLVDVRDMVVVHTALLRELRLAPAAVTRVGVGDRRGAARVERHLDLLCNLLHHHHSGEDDLLWPVLEPRLPAANRDLLAAAEAQHADIEDALERVGAARTTWVDAVDTSTRDALVADLTCLHALLAEHLEHEERHLLPLAAAHLSAAEWHAVGEHGASSVPKRDLLLVFGMFAYEGDPQVLALMLAGAPAPVRFVVPRIAPRVYARHARQIHGTTRP